MTNGEKIRSIFPNMNFGTLAQDDVIVNKDYSNNNEPQVFIPMKVWSAEYKEPTNTIDYRRAFKIACDLLNGDILYGVDADKIYELMMQKDDVVSSNSYEEYILNHLQELDRGQYASSSEIPNKSETKIDCDNTYCNNCVNHKYCDYESNKSEIPTGSDDCISRKAALEIYDEWFATCNIADRKASPKAKINALPSVTQIRPKGHWIDYSDEGYVECPICGSATNCDDNINDLHFCFSCGAEMEGTDDDKRRNH